ncbi:MAG: hypothetical protein U0231_09465 [Nitrospiraceae bacterium]
MATDKLGMIQPDKGRGGGRTSGPEVPTVPVLAERQGEMTLAKNVVFRRNR